MKAASYCKRKVSGKRKNVSVKSIWIIAHTFWCFYNADQLINDAFSTVEKVRMVDTGGMRVIGKEVEHLDLGFWP